MSEADALLADATEFLPLGVGMTGVGGLLVGLGVAQPPLLIGFAVLGFVPVLFLSLLWVGLKGDEVFGVEQAWDYTIPAEEDDNRTV